MIRQHALQLVGERCQIGLLFVRQRLATDSRIEAAQANGRAEAVGELGRIEHRVEEGHDVVLQIARFVDPVRGRQIVELASQFGDDARAGIRPAITTDEQHRHQSRIPAGEEAEVGSVRAHGLNHADHVRDVAG